MPGVALVKNADGRIERVAMEPDANGKLPRLTADGRRWWRWSQNERSLGILEERMNERAAKKAEKAAAREAPARTAGGERPQPKGKKG